MSIKIIDGTFQCDDNFGTSFNQYTANAGDTNTVTFDVEESINYLSSDIRPITCNPTLQQENKLRFPDYESINGFSVGQNVTLIRTEPNLSTTTKITTIISIDYEQNIIEFGSLLTPANKNLFYYGDNDTMQVYSIDNRGDLYFNLSFTKSTTQSLYNSVASKQPDGFESLVEGYRASFVDGTRTRYSVDAGSLNVNDDLDFSPLENLSGNFDVSINIERLANINAYTRKYRFILTLTQLGCFNDNIFFDIDTDFTKLYFDFEWYNSGLFENPTVVQWNFGNSLTAWFNKPFILNQPDSSVTEVIRPDNFAYDIDNNFTVTFETQSPQLGVGGIYAPEQDDLFANKAVSLSTSLMQIEMGGQLALNTYTSQANEVGGQWEVEITNIVVNLNDVTVDFTVRASNQEFIDFLESVNNDNRLFRLWFKVGFVNHLIIDEPMIKNPKQIEDIGLYFAGNDIFRIEDVTQVASVESVFPVEENVYYRSRLFLPKTFRYQNVKFEVVVAEIANLDNFFVLESLFFDLVNFPQGDDGVPILDADLFFNRSTNMPLTADDYIKARVGRINAPADTPTEFGFKLQFPFLVNWRYWLQQINAFDVFGNDRNKNWINYDDGTYKIYIKTTFEFEDRFLIGHSSIEKIWDYDEVHNNFKDSIWLGSTSIKYFVDAFGIEVPSLVRNQIVRVQVTVDGVDTPQSDAAAQVTIEPFESSPRWVTGTRYANDQNVNNPFLPLEGEDRLKENFINPTTYTYETLIDTSLLSEDKYKISFRFTRPYGILYDQVRSKFDVEIINSINSLLLNENELEDCDNVFSVFGLSGNDDPEKNDQTSAWKLLPIGASVEFELYKDDQLTTYQPVKKTFPSQSNAKYATIDWKQVLSQDGIGLYEYRLQYDDGINPVEKIIWGKYELQEYSEEKVRGLVNIRAKFNLNQQIEGINFAKSNVIDSMNVRGFFGNRDPKTEIDTIIDTSRINNIVKNENLNEYLFESDPLTKAFSRKIYDLYTISASEIFITDNNKFNHENYVNKKVFVSEVLSPEYYQWSNKIKVSIIFRDKKSDQRTFY